jgi:predicted membrane protein
MDFFFSGLFWGMILILLGLSIIIRIVFHINIPLVRIVFALVLIYFGIRVLVGGNWLSTTRNNTCFGASSVAEVCAGKEYKTVFGATTIDATAEVSGDTPERFSVKTVFGETKLIIAASVPTIIRAESAFGEARFPDGNSISFGNTVWKNSAAKTGATPKREIDANVVFGSFSVSER